MNGPRWIFALLGVLGLWIAISAILSLQSGVARRRDGKLILRSEQPDAFWRTVTIDLIGGIVAIAAAVAVIFFRLPMRP
jgi:hypothetical protein